MTCAERDRWDKLYRTGEFEPPETPSPLLRSYLDELPDGRALDVATGTGRNALYLAENGYDVDAIDVSERALERAERHRHERERNCKGKDEEGTDGGDRSLDIEWIRADIDDYDFPVSTYDAINVSFYYDLDRLTDIKAALAPGGVLMYEHHLRSATPVESGPSSDRFRLGSNDLLRACLDLTVLRYEERLEDCDGRTGARASLVARRSNGPSQTYLRGPASNGRGPIENRPRIEPEVDRESTRSRPGTDT